MSTTSSCRELSDLGEMLRCFRERRLWTQAALAEKAGLPEKTISNLETGTTRRPHLSTLNLLAEALDLNTDDRAAFIARRSGGPPPTPAAPPTLLPLPATSFLGREELVLRLRGMLTNPANRLLTLTGMGGIGKTRLALRVAEELADSIPDGVVVVDFAGIQDPALVSGTIAQALGVQPSAGRSIDDALIDYCATRQMVLVLDNFEQVVAAATFVDRLIAESSQLAVLVTSRERLALKRERLVSVRALTLPPDVSPPETIGIDVAMQSEAVRLFVERAQAVQPTFQINDTNVDDIAEICRRLDGIPLALELAAARIPHVGSPSYLRQRLHQSLSWLTTNLRDQASRHRTMRAAIDWSYESLDPAEQAIFRHLSVFAGGFTIDAADEGLGVRGWGLGGDNGSGKGELGIASSFSPSPQPLSPSPSFVLDGITSLVEKNLVQLYDGPDGGTRYRLLETIREYGLEKLAQSGEGERIREAHSATYLAMAERGEKELSGPNHAGWLARLKVEQDNIRTALDWSISAGDAERSLRFGSALWRFWAATGRVQEGGAFLERAIALDGALPSGLRSKALRRLGNMAVERADYRAAREYFTASLATARDEGDTIPAAQALSSLGFVAYNLGDYQQAKDFLDEALTFWKSTANTLDQAVTLQTLGFVAFAVDQFDEAELHHYASLRLRRNQGDALGVAYSSVWLGQLARLTGKWDEARKWLDSALDSFRQGGDQAGEGYTLFELAMLYRSLGDEQTALTLTRQSLEVRHDAGDVQSIVDSIEGLALLLWDRGESEDGIKLFAAAAAWRSDQGVVLHPPLQRTYEVAMTRLREEIGNARFESAWRIGHIATLDQTSTQALILAEQ